MKCISLPIVVAAGVAGLLLGGCSVPAGLKALDRAATSEDTLPAFVILPEGVSGSSARLLVTQDGVRYFAAESDDARTACVAVVPPGESPDWHVGCSDASGPGQIVTVSGQNGSLSTTLLADGSDTGKLVPGWTKIADNILVSDR